MLCYAMNCSRYAVQMQENVNYHIKKMALPYTSHRAMNKQKQPHAIGTGLFFIKVTSS